jgi:hypothetical protein
MKNPHLDHQVLPEHHDHVFEYTKHSYKLNDILFFGDAASDEDAVRIDGIKKATSIPAKYDFVVFSGLKWSPFDMWDEHDVDYEHPLQIHLPAFTSTSTDFNIACGFSRALPKPSTPPVMDKRARGLYNRSDEVFNLLELTVSAGTHVASVMHISKFRHEKEFILKSGLNIKLEPHPTIKDVGGYVFIVWKGKTMVD